MSKRGKKKAPRPEPLNISERLQRIRESLDEHRRSALVSSSERSSLFQSPMFGTATKSRLHSSDESLSPFSRQMKAIQHRLHLLSSDRKAVREMDGMKRTDDSDISALKPMKLSMHSQSALSPMRDGFDTHAAERRRSHGHVADIGAMSPGIDWSELSRLLPELPRADAGDDRLANDHYDDAAVAAALSPLVLKPCLSTSPPSNSGSLRRGAENSHSSHQRDSGAIQSHKPSDWLSPKSKSKYESKSKKKSDLSLDFGLKSTKPKMEDGTLEAESPLMDRPLVNAKGRRKRQTTRRRRRTQLAVVNSPKHSDAKSKTGFSVKNAMDANGSELSSVSSTLARTRKRVRQREKLRRQRKKRLAELQRLKGREPMAASSKSKSKHTSAGIMQKQKKNDAKMSGDFIDSENEEHSSMRHQRDEDIAAAATGSLVESSFVDVDIGGDIDAKHFGRDKKFPVADGSLVKAKRSAEVEKGRRRLTFEFSTVAHIDSKLSATSTHHVDNGRVDPRTHVTTDDKEFGLELDGFNLGFGIGKTKTKQKRPVESGAVIGKREHGMVYRRREILGRGRNLHSVTGAPHSSWRRVGDESLSIGELFMLPSPSPKLPTTASSKPRRLLQRFSPVGSGAVADEMHSESDTNATTISSGYLHRFADRFSKMDFQQLDAGKEELQRSKKVKRSIGGSPLRAASTQFRHDRVFGVDADVDLTASTAPEVIVVGSGSGQRITTSTKPPVDTDIGTVQKSASDEKRTDAADTSATGFPLPRHLVSVFTTATHQSAVESKVQSVSALGSVSKTEASDGRAVPSALATPLPFDGAVYGSGAVPHYALATGPSSSPPRIPETLLASPLRKKKKKKKRVGGGQLRESAKAAIKKANEVVLVESSGRGLVEAHGDCKCECHRAFGRAVDDSLKRGAAADSSLSNSSEQKQSAVTTTKRTAKRKQESSEKSSAVKSDRRQSGGGQVTDRVLHSSGSGSHSRGTAAQSMRAHTYPLALKGSLIDDLVLLSAVSIAPIRTQDRHKLFVKPVAASGSTAQTHKVLYSLLAHLCRVHSASGSVADGSGALRFEALRLFKVQWANDVMRFNEPTIGFYLKHCANAQILFRKAQSRFGCHKRKRATLPIHFQLCAPRSGGTLPQNAMVCVLDAQSVVQSKDGSGECRISASRCVPAFLVRFQP